MGWGVAGDSEIEAREKFIKQQGDSDHQYIIHQLNHIPVPFMLPPNPAYVSWNGQRYFYKPDDGGETEAYLSVLIAGANFVPLQPDR